MLKIDCLVINTQLQDDLRDAVHILANERAGNKKDASLMSVYNDLRQAGIEIDLRSVGHIYANTLDLNDKNFNTMQEVEEVVGAKFEKTVRNLVMMQDKEGEKQISDQSPGQAVAQGIAQAFYNAHSTDTRTQSVLRTLQDAMQKGAKRLVGELPSLPVSQKGFEEIVQKALDIEKVGYRDLNGAINGIKKLFEDTRKELAALTSRMGESDQFHQDQWDEYVTNLENAAYSLLFSKAEAKQVVYDAMKKAGFGKTTSSGKEILDWNRLAGGVHDVSQIRQNVDNALKESGFSDEAREAVKTSLEKEYHELRGEILRRAGQTAANTTPPEKTLNTILDRALSYQDRGYTMAITNTEAKQVVSDAIKEAGYTKEDAAGNVTLDWTKMSGDLRSKEAVQKVVENNLIKQGYSPSDIASVRPFVDNAFKEMQAEIAVRADKELSNREKRMNADKKSQKDDFTRLAELSALGIFKRQHDAVLHRMLGVSDLKDQDIAQIEAISKTASDLSRELEGKDYLGGYIFQNLQRNINSIIARNIADKTTALKVVSTIGKYFQALNLGRIANAFNMLENNLSGTKELMSTNLRVLSQMGRGEAFKDFKLLAAVFADVTKGGVSYGEDFGRFSNQEMIDDIFREVKFKNQDVKGIAKSLVTMTMRAGRAFLSGSDSAFKALLHKKIMKLALHRALIENGKTKEEANRFLNEALYGESFEDAQGRAASMLKKYNLPVSKTAVMRLANDLVVGNLNVDGQLSDDLIEAAHDSAYHVAGIGMGHESQTANIFAVKVQNGKQAAAQRDAQLIKDENWKALANHRFLNGVYYGAIAPFLGGVYNWALLRIQSGFGIGIATGLLGNYKGDIDYASKESIRNSVEEVENKRQQIARGIVGLTYAGLTYGLVAAVNALKGAVPPPDDKDKNGNPIPYGVFGDIKNDYFLQKAFLRSAPDLMAISYLMHTEKSDGQMALKYVNQYLNLGTDYSTDVQLVKIGQDLARGNKQSAEGELGQMIGSKLDFPLWRSYKGMYQLVDWGAAKVTNGAIGNDAKPTYKAPYTFAEGLFGGNMLEDAGIFQRNSPIEALPGVGGKTGEKMRAAGINNMNDLKDHPGWEGMIPNADSRAKATKAYREVYSRDAGDDNPPAEQSKQSGNAGGSF